MWSPECSSTPSTAYAILLGKAPKTDKNQHRENTSLYGYTSDQGCNGVVSIFQPGKPKSSKHPSERVNNLYFVPTANKDSLQNEKSSNQENNLIKIIIKSNLS